METPTSLTSDLKLRDIITVVELLKTRSLRDFSRRFGGSPGQISKQVKAIESKLGMRLFDRSSQGVEATPEAMSIMSIFEKIYDLHLKLTGELNPEEKENLLGFASTSFLSTSILPRVFAKFEQQVGKSKFRLFDLPPDRFIAAGLRGAFQVCLHFGDLDWPKTWTSVQVGSVKWQLYCRHDHPLAKRPHLQKILQYPFIYPIYRSTEGIRYGNDRCPLPLNKRNIGHETATATSAIELVSFSNHLAFLPNVVAESLLRQKQVRILPVPSWKKVEEPLFLTVKNDFVKKKTFEILKTIIGDEL